jgi:hypothetical protein
MSVKTTGAEYKAYMNESDPKWWSKDAYMDDELLTVDGKSTSEQDNFDSSHLSDDAIVIIEGGTYHQSYDDDNPISLESHFKRWRKAQTTVRIAVEVHKDKLEALKAAIKLAGGKVI